MLATGSSSSSSDGEWEADDFETGNTPPTEPTAQTIVSKTLVPHKSKTLKPATPSKSQAYHEMVGKAGGRPPTPIPEPPKPPTPPPAQPHVFDEYRQYITKKKTPGTHGYDQYPGQPRGTHRSFGTRIPGRRGKKYPEHSQLGASHSGYADQHPSERDLQQVPATGQRSVYGFQDDLPIHGPADYDQYYTDWTVVGVQHEVPIPAGKALPDDELDFIQSYGITFDRKVGSGGFGTVWVTNTTRLFKDQNNQYINKQVACKVLSLESYQNPNDSVQYAVKKLLAESLIYKDLDHANIVNVGHVMHIHDPVTGFPYCRCLMFMDLCTGDLKSLLESLPTKRMTETDAFVMFNQVTDGLMYLHHKNMVHMDIKIHNVLYLQEGSNMTYKLADFGLSKKFGEGEKAEMFGQTGTTLYMAPEFNRYPLAPKQCKPADVYTCGLVLAECLAGKGQWDRLLSDLNAGYAPLLASRWGLTDSLQDLIKRMTVRIPADRITISGVRQHQWFLEKSI